MEAFQNVFDELEEEDVTEEAVAQLPDGADAGDDDHSLTPEAAGDVDLAPGPPPDLIAYAAGLTDTS